MAGSIPLRWLLQRRQGIGKALVRHLEAALARKGCTKINLQVHTYNYEVVAFYQKLGYAIEERISMGKLLPSGTGKVPSGA